MNSRNSLFDYNSDDIRSGAVEAPAGEQQAGEEKKKSRMGRLVYILIIVGISVILSVFLISGAVKRINSGLVMELQVGDVYAAYLEDGLYSGSYSSAGMSAEVTVDVAEGYIMDISLNSFEDIDTSRVQAVFDAVIAAQSLDTGIEDIGTQPTDLILLKAVESALNGDSHGGL